MFTPMTTQPKRSQIRTEREYREWQMALRGIVPARRLKDKPGYLTRLANAFQRAANRENRPIAASRRLEQETLDFANSKHLS